MTKTVIGIDPSLSATAVCFGPIDNPQTRVFSSKNRGDDVANRIQRFAEMAGRISQWVGLLSPGLVIIEGYSFGSANHRAEAMAEFGGLLRWRLLSQVRNVVEFAPTSLKKWATGKGNAKKPIVCASLVKRYGVEFSTDDEYDAYAAWRIGWQILELDTPANRAQEEVIEKFRKSQERKQES